MTATIMDLFKAAVGPNGWTDAADDIAPHVVEWRGLYSGKTPLLLKPSTTDQVAAIMRIAHDTRTPLAIQGGNTGLVGGGVPDDSGHEVLVSLTRLNNIRDVDAAGFAMTAEAGVTVTALHDHAKSVDRLFPLSLASEGSCTLGGVISTNAGGVNVLRYGSMRDLTLGIEAVLPTGEIWHGLKSLRKDNTGYDLKQLFIGSEGTLGVVTAATIKLFPAPRDVATAFLAVPSPSAAIALLAEARAATGDGLTAFELMPRLGLEIVLAHIPNSRDPLSTRSPWYVLVEAATGSNDDSFRSHIDAFISTALENGLVTDGVLAQSNDQARALWRLRESLSEAQKHEGGSIKHDISVPIAKIPDFIARGAAVAEKIVAGARPVPFGHLGDGNLHFNIQSPAGMDRKAFEQHWAAMNRAIHDVVVDMGGSISAEHGIGRLKREELAHYKPALDLRMMHQLKAVFDPHGILNPGRVIAAKN